MSEQAMPVEGQKRFNPLTAVLLILPLIALAGVIILFLNTGGGLQLSAPAPVEDLTVERTVLKPGSIDIIVRNGSPEALTIAQVIINDAVWPMTVSPNVTIPRLGEATVHLDYHWRKVRPTPSLSSPRTPLPST